MRGFLLAFLPTAFAVICPTGYTYWSQTNKCYKAYEDPITFFAASVACSNDDAELVSIHNSFENNFIVQNVTAEHFTNHWIGIQNMMDGYAFTWLDDSPLNYVHWDVAQPNAEWNCGVMNAKSFTWSTQQCNVQYPYICVYDPTVNKTCPTCPTQPPCHSCPPKPSCSAVENRVLEERIEIVEPKSITMNTLSCPQGYFGSSTNVKCYKVNNKAETFFQASQLCSLDDGELVSIHSLEENGYVQDLLPSTDYDQPFWIGMTNLLDDWGQWAWLDESNPQYFNWMGRPNTSMNCAKIHSLNGEWTTQNCGMSFPYICEFDPTKKHECPSCPAPVTCPTCPTYPPCPKATTPPPPPCDSGWIYNATFKSCYLYVKGGTNNGAANTNCRSHGAYLSSVHSEAENNFLFNIAGSGTLWLGIHRTGAGAGCVTCFANDDGTPFDYWKWGSGEPNNVAGAEYCVEMYTFNGNQNGYIGTYWNDISCNNYIDYYICKKTARS